MGRAEDGHGQAVELLAVAYAPIAMANVMQLTVMVWVASYTSLHLCRGTALQRCTLAYFYFGGMQGLGGFAAEIGTNCLSKTSIRYKIFQGLFALSSLAFAVQLFLSYTCMLLRLRVVRPRSKTARAATLCFLGVVAGVVIIIIVEVVEFMASEKPLSHITVFDYTIAAVTILLAFVLSCICALGFRIAAGKVAAEEQLNRKDSTAETPTSGVESISSLQPPAEASRWLNRTALLTVLFVVTTAVYCVIFFSVIAGNKHLASVQVTYSCTYSIEIVCDILYSLILAELLYWPRMSTKPRLQHSKSNLQSAGRIVVHIHERKIREKLQQARQSSASVLAGLLGGRGAAQVLESAKARFRHISWDVLAENYSIIASGGLTSEGQFAHTLYELSGPAELGSCDAFLSHSWHDSADVKWDALQEWCEDFRAKHGRAPTLWLDKVCIDQTDITSDLTCLPVFLAACNTMLILSGSTYTTRLWCVLELYVFISMQGESEATIVPLNAEEYNLMNTWTTFDVRSCQCFDARDKTRILSIIEDHHSGGVEAFNEDVRAMMSRTFGSKPMKLRSTTIRRTAQGPERCLSPSSPGRSADGLGSTISTLPALSRQMSPKGAFWDAAAKMWSSPRASRARCNSGSQRPHSLYGSQETGSASFRSGASMSHNAISASSRSSSRHTLAAATPARSAAGGGSDDGGKTCPSETPAGAQPYGKSLFPLSL